MFLTKPRAWLLVPALGLCLAPALAEKPAAGTALADRLDSYLQARVRVQDFSGSVLVARDGQVLFSKGYGLADREHDVPNTPSTKFRLGSLTKPFTAVAILLLEEKGKLKVADPVSKHWPDCPKTWAEVTLHQLLSHTGGIPEHTDKPAFWRRRTQPTRPLEILNLVREEPLDFTPGKDFTYSNTGYVLLGLVIERVSGRPYAEFLREEIFQPLGMADTGYDQARPILKHRARGYVRSGKGHFNAPYLDMSLPYAAGGLYSTVEDLFRWEQALASGKLLAPERRDQLFTPVKEGYGYGWAVSTRYGRPSAGHGGTVPGFRTSILRLLDDRVFVTVLSNVTGTPTGDIATDLAGLVLGEKVELPQSRQEAGSPKTEP